MSDLKNMSELDRLIKQRKEIDKKIKELKNNSVLCGRAKLDVEHYPTQLPDRHYVAIMTDESYLGGNRNRWRTVANGKTRDDAINQIPTIINDLQSLYNQVKGGQS